MIDDQPDTAGGDRRGSTPATAASDRDPLADVPSFMEPTPENIGQRRHDFTDPPSRPRAPALACPACGRPVDEPIMAVVDTLWPDRCDTCGWRSDTAACGCNPAGPGADNSWPDGPPHYDEDCPVHGQRTRGRHCPHGCSDVSASAGHERGCPLGRTFPPFYETHDQAACPECSTYFSARGEAVPS